MTFFFALFYAEVVITKVLHVVGLILFFFKEWSLLRFIPSNCSDRLRVVQQHCRTPFGEVDLSTGRFRYLGIRVQYFLKFFFN